MKKIFSMRSLHKQQDSEQQKKRGFDGAAYIVFFVVSLVLVAVIAVRVFFPSSAIVARDSRTVYSSLHMLTDKAQEADGVADVLEAEGIDPSTLTPEGAQRVVEFKSIDEISQAFSVPWALRRFIGDYELVSLYIIGGNMMLGLYEHNETGERINAHISVGRDIETMSAVGAYDKYTIDEESGVYVYYKGEEVQGFGIIMMVSAGGSVSTEYYIFCSSTVPIEAEVINDFIDGVWTEADVAEQGLTE